MATHTTLGTLLRHLTELCDGGVEQAYAADGLDYRPRYTPVMRALRERGTGSIKDIASAAGVTHSAASQTVAQMARGGLVRIEPGPDARERIVVLTARAKRLFPQLEGHWIDAESATRELDDALGLSLPDVLRQAIALLEGTPLATRMTAHRLRRQRKE